MLVVRAGGAARERIEQRGAGVAVRSDAQDAFAIVPHDTDEQRFSSLYVGGVGNVTITTLSDRVVTFTAVPAGTHLRVAGKRVRATLTTASLMVGIAGGF